MTFEDKLNQWKVEHEYQDNFETGVRASKEVLKPTLDKVIDAFDSVKVYLAVESQVGQKLKAAIKEYKELQL